MSIWQIDIADDEFEIRSTTVSIIIVMIVIIESSFYLFKHSQCSADR